MTARSTAIDAEAAERRLIVYSAALIFAVAGALNLVESQIPGGPTIAPYPGIAALAVAAAIALLGRRLPLTALASLGPLGAVMITGGLATTSGPGDGAVLYLWPVLWETYFFGRRGAIAIVLTVALAHGVAVLAMPGGDGYFDRWLDVVVSVAIVATIVEVLGARNRRLLLALATEARTDSLTGLLNRGGFGERAAAELSRARREERGLALVSFDLDHFKVINDEFGHDVGDRVLAHMADRLRAEVRTEDVLARMGGEEFVVLLPGQGIEEARAFAERARRAIAVAVDGLPQVTLSAGAAAAGPPADLGQLLKAADRALYRAKAAGRNRTDAEPALV